MRLRSRILLTAGLAVSFDGRGRRRRAGSWRRRHKWKFGKFSKRGHAALKVEVRGAITALDAARSPSPRPRPRRLPVAPGERHRSRPAPRPGPRARLDVRDPGGLRRDRLRRGRHRQAQPAAARTACLTAYQLRAAGKSAVKIVHGPRPRGSAELLASRSRPAARSSRPITPDVHHRRPRHRRRGRHAPHVTCAIGKRTRSFGTISARRHRQDRVQEQERRARRQEDQEEGRRRRIGQIQVEVKPRSSGFGSTQPHRASRAAVLRRRGRDAADRPRRWRLRRGEVHRQPAHPHQDPPRGRQLAASVPISRAR